MFMAYKNENNNFLKVLLPEQMYYVAIIFKDYAPNENKIFKSITNVEREVWNNHWSNVYFYPEKYQSCDEEDFHMG